MPLRDHPKRLEFNDEVHARPPESLRAPIRISYLALLVGDETRERGWKCVQDLAARYGVTPPDAHSDHFSADLGPFRLKCERHTEFLRFKFIVSGIGDSYFCDAVIEAVPRDWLATLPGELIVAANVTIAPEREQWLDFDRHSAESFDGNNLVGASIAGGAATAITDFRVYPDGFSRLLVFDRTMTPRQTGRMIQRLLEMETYRILALMALPIARALSPVLTASERELTDITQILVHARDRDEPILFERLTRLAAEIESKQSQSHYRFEAAAAYHNLVRRRIAELREERIPGLQTFKEFIERRLAPAMDTCQSAAAQHELLSQRLARATQLLSTRVDLTRQAQNQRLLASMNRRANLQLRLQETVERLSVAAISYYIVGLVGYAAKGAKAAGWHLDTDIVMAVSIPIVIAAIALALHRFRRTNEHEVP